MKRTWFGLGVLVVCVPAAVACSGDDDGGGGIAGEGGTGTGGTSSGGMGSGGSGWPDAAAGSGGAVGGSAGQGASGGTGGVAGGSGGTSTGGNGATGGTSTGGTGGGATGGTGGNTGGTGGTSYNPICLGTQAGAYCGNDMMKDADPNVLYQCNGANKPPTSSTPCPNGCVVEAAGTADHCKTVTSPTGYRLPWKPGVTMQLTQDCNDSCCADHINDDGYAWDWANGTAFVIVAARGGEVTHLKINSTSGCGTSSCANSANFIVIDHKDGTHATYLHLGGMTLQAGVTCGATVQRGQALAKAGTTGWSTGVHLHFQVSKVPAGGAKCECGPAGTGCPASSVPWSSFWSTTAYPTIPIQFEEWAAASSCNDRRITMPASQNQ